MSTTELISLVIASVSALGVIAAVIFSFRQNEVKVTQTVIAAQKEQIDLQKDQIVALDKRVQTCEGLHREALQERGNMQGQLDSMKELLQGRDPVSQKLNTAAIAYMNHSTKMLETLLQHFQISIPPIAPIA